MPRAVTRPAADMLRGDLDELANVGDLPPRLVQLCRELLEIESGVGREASSPDPTPTDDAARRCMSEGQPLLSPGGLGIDWTVVSDTYREVKATFCRYRDLFRDMPAESEAWPGEPVTEHSLQTWLEVVAAPSSGASGKDARWQVSQDVVLATVRPFLSAVRDTLLDSVDQENWRRGYCPICGGMPDFAFLDSERGARWLVCSRCDAEWMFQRLECPYCGTTDQNSLAYFTSDERPYRLYVCALCHGYLKAVDLRRVESDVLIPLERLLTLDLDRLAHDMGYRPPG
jgi:hypothetical protein